MKSPLLITLAVVVLSTYCQGATKFRGVVSMFDELVNSVTTCTGYCLVPNLKELIQSTSKHCRKTINDIEANKTQNVPGHTVESFYNYAVKRQGSSTSYLCSWARSFSFACQDQRMEDHCDYKGIRMANDRITTGILDYICSLDPPVAECALHPDAWKEYSVCVTPLRQKFGKYFEKRPAHGREVFELFRNFYENEIKKNDGESVYSAAEDYVKCLSSKAGDPIVVAGMNCASVQRLVDEEIENVIKYLKNTDILSCDWNPDLWEKLQDCGEDAFKKLKEHVNTHYSTTPATITSTTNWPFHRSAYPYAKLAEELMDGNYQILQGFYMPLKACALPEIEKTCGQGWTYKLVTKQLSVLDAIFESKERAASEVCEALNEELLNPSSGSSALVISNMMAAAMVVLVIRF